MMCVVLYGYRSPKSLLRHSAGEGRTAILCGKGGMQMLFTEDVAPSGKNKTSAKKNVVTILIAVLAIAAVLAAVWLYRNPPEENDRVLGDPEKLETVQLSRTITSIPYMSTDFDNVFYTADAAGNVLFYEFDGADFVELAETGTMDLSVPLSGQQIPAKIHYIERDGHICGYGVFSTEGSDDEDVYIYSFMMFKVTDLPAAYAADGRCLLLAHTDRTQAYAQEPVWEESYIVNRADGSMTRFLSENNRTIGINGGMREDFCMITDEALTATGKSIPFFSSRNHEQSQNGDTPIDIYTKVDNRETSAAVSVAECYVKPLENDAFAFVRETNNGFETVRYENGEESVISSFYAGYGTSYIRSGDYILSKEDGRVYTTYDKTVLTPQDYKINPLVFAVSPDGKYIVMGGTVANALDYQIYVYNTETGRSVTYTETNYAEHGNMRFINDTTVMFYVINVEGFENVVLDLSAVR